jgi:hypothetical protein
MDLPWDGAAKLLSAGPLGLGAIIILVTGGILLSKQPLPKEKFYLAISMLVVGGLLTMTGFFILHEQITTTASQAGTACLMTFRRFKAKVGCRLRAFTTRRRREGWDR